MTDGKFYHETYVQRFLSWARSEEALHQRRVRSPSIPPFSPSEESSPDLAIGSETGGAVWTLIAEHKLDCNQPTDESAQLGLAQNIAQLVSAHEAFGTALGVCMVNTVYCRTLVLAWDLVAVETTGGAVTAEELRQQMEDEDREEVAEFCSVTPVEAFPHQMRAGNLESARPYLDWVERAATHALPFSTGELSGALAFNAWNPNAGTAAPQPNGSRGTPSAGSEQPSQHTSGSSENNSGSATTSTGAEGQGS